MSNGNPSEMDRLAYAAYLAWGDTPGGGYEAWRNAVRVIAKKLGVDPPSTITVK